MINHFFQNIEGWFSFKDQYDRMIKELPQDATVVEVGTWHGKSLAYLIVESLNQNKKFKIYSVDSYDNDYETFYSERLKKDKNFLNDAYICFKNNLKDYEKYYTQYKCKSWNGASFFNDETIDYVMIDAGHKYEDVKKDLNAYWAKIKKGGYMGGDDYNVNNTVGQAVDEFVREKNLKLETEIAKHPITKQLSTKQSIWVIRK